MFKIELPGLFAISGSTARVTRSKPSTLVWNIVSQSSSRPEATGSRPCAPPALLISTSTAGGFRARPFHELLHACRARHIQRVAGAGLADFFGDFFQPVHPARAQQQVGSPAPRTRAPPPAPNPLEAPVINTHLPDSDEFIGRA